MITTNTGNQLQYSVRVHGSLELTGRSCLMADHH